jgi:DNA invertase Pin-like site-specific DNA recombinase
MLVGYARVSTPDQSLNLQRDALKKTGCKRIFSDVAGGAGVERPGLAKALEYVRRGDTLVVWKLDRFGRSLRDLVESVNALKERKVGFRSLQEALDTTTSGGRLVFHVFAALAEFERDLIRERTQAGLKAARARGRMGGRPRILTGKRLELAQALFNDPKNSPRDIAKTIGVSLATLYRYVRPPTVTSSTTASRDAIRKRTSAVNPRGKPARR